MWVIVHFQRSTVNNAYEYPTWIHECKLAFRQNSNKINTVNLVTSDSYRHGSVLKMFHLSVLLNISAKEISCMSFQLRCLWCSNTCVTVRLVVNKFCNLCNKCAVLFICCTLYVKIDVCFDKCSHCQQQWRSAYGYQLLLVISLVSKNKIHKFGHCLACHSPFTIQQHFRE